MARLGLVAKGQNLIGILLENVLLSFRLINLIRNLIRKNSIVIGQEILLIFGLDKAGYI